MTGITVTTPSDLELRITREFDAPRELVWACSTEAEHLKHWWGRGNPLDVEIDLRVGGRYRFVEHADGVAHAFRGEFREIVPPERLTMTFEYEGDPGHIAVQTIVLEERDGRTYLTGTTRFDSRADRDGMMDSGMEAGANKSYEALDRYLEKLRG
jgi:uncharacterized protein YndB with AHSA1/START domain